MNRPQKSGETHKTRYVEFSVCGTPLQGETHPLAQPLNPREPVAGLYLHTPFCFHKCHYCDFYSIVDPTDPAQDRQTQFVDALIAELTQAASVTPLRPRTIFVGGGTPTLLREPLWERLLSTLRELGVLQDVREFTVEANPETVSPSLLRLLADGGVNRLSIGAQSFDPTLLKMLERWHEPASVGRAVAMARDAGIGEVNLDLIFAIPGQTRALLDTDLNAALALEPTHLSCYSLIFEPNTAMTQRLRMGQIAPAEEDLERAMYAQVIERLDAAGFAHYEISNWARTTPCAHNLVYWHNENWLGCGPSAASHIEGHRWKNVPHLGKYIDGTPLPPTMDHERLDADRHIGEALMLALRLREGAPLTWLAQHLPPQDSRHTVINELIGLGFLERTDTHLRLTHQALFVADSVIAKLL